MKEINKAKSVVSDKVEEGGEDILITFEELQKLPLNEIISFNPGGKGIAEALAIETGDEDTLTFRLVIDKGTVFNSHKHDCIENIIIYKGSMLNLKTKTILDRGSVIIFRKFEVHHLQALEDTICYVELEKP